LPGCRHHDGGGSVLLFDRGQFSQALIVSVGPVSTSLATDIHIGASPLDWAGRSRAYEANQDPVKSITPDRT